MTIEPSKNQLSCQPTRKFSNNAIAIHLPQALATVTYDILYSVHCTVNCAGYGRKQKKIIFQIFSAFYPTTPLNWAKHFFKVIERNVNFTFFSLLFYIHIIYLFQCQQDSYYYYPCIMMFYFSDITIHCLHSRYSEYAF
jgi:hypothetical protein